MTVPADILNALNQHPWLLYSSLLVLGLIVGSFLNVLVLRLPIMLEHSAGTDCAELPATAIPTGHSARPFNLLHPASHCPTCRQALKPWHNIPVLSYLLLRGHCGHCGCAISLRYPGVELLSAALALLLGWHFSTADVMWWALPAALLFSWTLLALSLIDMDHMQLPDCLTLPLLWLGLLFNLGGTFARLQDAVLGAAAGYLCLWSVYWLFRLATGREGMGRGDFKLLAALGAWLGWQLLPLIILLSTLAGSAFGAGQLLLHRRGGNVPLPFGPWLALAGGVAMLWGAPLLDWYWHILTGRTGL